jgi:hypothetical protein
MNAADFAPGVIDILKEQNIPGMAVGVADTTNIDCKTMSQRGVPQSPSDS